MMSLFTITGMAIIRYLSVVLLQRSWHTPIKHSIWCSRSIWIVLTIAFVLSTPPLIGFGKYVKDSSVIWYECNTKLMIQSNRIFLITENKVIHILSLIQCVYALSFCAFLFSCAPSWSTKSNLGIVYNWSIISFGFVLPTLVICVCASLTIRRIYQVTCL